MADNRILLAHGSGGKLSHELVKEFFLPVFDNPILNRLDDRAEVEVAGVKLAYTTDSFVVNPLFFEGGDIGKLAVCGTVNDLAMGGAEPLFLSVGFIIEEGFSLDMLRDIVTSMKKTADEAGVKIVCGDTKVVEKGSADQIFINTSGIGAVPEGVCISGDLAKPGDKVIINGFIGDHGIAVMAKRQGLSFKDRIASDCAPLNGLVKKMMEVSKDIHVLRDPTRGGVATTLNEIAAQSSVGIVLNESALPVREEVQAACEILGFDPLYVANEGKLLALVPAEIADRVVDAMKHHPYGREAAIIGEITADHPGKVVLATGIGGRRIVDMLVGEQLPRIC
ncbi:MAG: hydrogenase expression/formation protein HypE [Firmicutes bacterium HGW-Firmicutes-8]|nr:MAG: hydrogenase expression/formation protein HypE [Firmicutes bacterium HGW-Firmicutes-8]